MPETNADQLNNALSALNGAIPIALFPVKVQTRFATQPMVDALGNGPVPAPDPAAAPVELWVRIYPDDIFVHTHEDRLTEDERSAAWDYWAALWAAAGQTGRQAQQAGAWRSLSEDYGPVSTRYILRETRPIGGLDEEGFPQSVPQLPDLETTEESWSNAPRTYLLPDHFVVSVERAGSHRHYKGAQIDKTEDGALRLGLDPSSPDEFEDTPKGRQVPED